MNKLRVILLFMLMAGASAQTIKITAFAPSLQGSPTQAGLNVTVQSGVAVISNVPTTVPTQTVAVGANTTTYIYLDMATGLLATNTSGFAAAQYPIATAISFSSVISGLTDSRPDVFGISGAASGTVTSVTGTANQISVATGTTTPVLSLSATLVAPGTITATTSTASPFYVSTAADPADAGVIRLGNAQLIEWEANPTGVDLTAGMDANNVFSTSVPINAITGFQIAGTAASGNYLRGNGTNFISSAFTPADCTTCVLNNAVNTATTAMTLNLSASTVANAFQVPVGAGLTSGANGAIAYDSTAGITHLRTNGADSTAVTATATSTTTTQVLHATAVAGIGSFSAIATGDLPATVVRTDQANTGGVAMTLNMGASTTANSFIVPVGAGLTSGADGVIAYDTTQKNTHIRTNGADTLAVAETAAIAATALLKSASATKSLATASSVLDDGVTVTSAEPYVFGTVAGSPNTDKTIGVLTSAMGAQTTATVTNVTNMTWNVAANKNYVMHCTLPITFAASATIAFAIGGPGTPTSHTINAGPDLGIAGAFGDVSLVNSATYGTKTTASGAVAGTQVIVLDAIIRNGATASGTALTLQTAANGTNAITMLADGACSLTQTN